MSARAMDAAEIDAYSWLLAQQAQNAAADDFACQPAGAEDELMFVPYNCRPFAAACSSCRRARLIYMLTRTQYCQ